MSGPTLWIVAKLPGERGWQAIGLSDVMTDDGRGATVYTTRDEAEVAAGNDEVEMVKGRAL